MKLKLHPLFFVLAIFMILLGHARLFFCSIFAVLAHESAHFFAARARGYMMKETVLTPYGAVLYGNERLDKTSELFIAIAGPLASFLFALLTAALWWIFPSTYAFTYDFFGINLSLAVFNLLPAFPLDGSRIVLALSKNRLKTLKILKICGILLSAALFVLFVLSLLFGFNISLGILSVFLFIGATFGTEKERYFSVADAANGAKDFASGVLETTVHISADVPTVRLLQHIKPKTFVTFVIVDKSGHPIARLSEKHIGKLLEYGSLSSPLISNIKLALPNIVLDNLPP